MFNKNDDVENLENEGGVVSEAEETENEETENEEIENNTAPVENENLEERQVEDLVASIKEMQAEGKIDNEQYNNHVTALCRLVPNLTRSNVNNYIKKF